MGSALIRGNAPLVAGAPFVGMMRCIELGRRIGVRRAAQEGEGARAGVGAVDGAVCALLGLLVASPPPAPPRASTGAAIRSPRRRTRSALPGCGSICFPPASQSRVRDLFRRYLDARLEAYNPVGPRGGAGEARGR